MFTCWASKLFKGREGGCGTIAGFSCDQHESTVGIVFQACLAESEAANFRGVQDSELF